MEVKTILLSISFIFIIVVTGSAIANFFDIGHLYYIPFIMWGISLTIFNLILSKSRKNIYMVENTDNNNLCT